MGVSVTLDTSEWDAFVHASPRTVAAIKRRFFEQGSQIVRSLMVLEATKRFGVETGESHMQSVDSGRPKGFYAASISTDVSGDEALIAPFTPYSWWVEEGSRAPSGVPATHKGSQFIGHRPVSRAVEQAPEPLGILLEDVVSDALRGA